jgi:hypothetical protein
MAVFAIQSCCFNCFYKSRNNGVLTLRYAKKLRSEPFSVKSKSEYFLLTPRYAAQQRVNSALCCIAQSHIYFANISELATICKNYLTR